MTPVPPPGSHGGDGARLAAALDVGRDDVLDLSVSLNPVAPNLRTLVARHLDALSRYPDATESAAVLADAVGVDRDRLLLTNGGAEAIALVAAEMGGGAREPEFSLHPRGTGPGWRSNPHNPTGLLAPPEAAADVWDEAFYPLATGRWTRGDAGAVVVGSLTKLFACPGLRLGYVLADPALIERLRRRQPEWSVNGLATAVVPDLLDVADLPGWAKAVADLRAELIDVLYAHGLDPLASDANFVLCRSAEGLRARLGQEAILVRDCTNFGLPGHARIAVPDEAGLARLARVLDRTGPRHGRTRTSG